MSVCLQGITAFSSLNHLPALCSLLCGPTPVLVLTFLSPTQLGQCREKPKKAVLAHTANTYERLLYAGPCATLFKPHNQPVS